ncbi:Oidioi.mRNA.OKI2018_I69.PAR.g9654.t1.cds [Oikopleura dioica]|uniref:Oidioi.mRNA.OKI2018_I69.PAR.g9654.t1.cds n=1 Tax=Oikopleura dioica TaxID=34765 RepID=A0ABN7RLR6_OIKDI|nr:Oidioi.mRNA.OKI2018_I69.PAR.g9654.t1.cds [Oikopleura dioica]
MIQLLFANEYQNSANFRRVDRRNTRKNVHSKSAIGAGAKMGMISVAGAPNIIGKIRRPSYVKTQDHAITIDRIQRLVTETPKVPRKTVFMANMEQNWKHVDSVAWVILLTTAFECLIEGENQTVNRSDCHFHSDYVWNGALCLPDFKK